ncbi:hypothetical protein H072_721 [Dactylellina haptotyla CBS 200.50]|uniref:Allergen n=1 Tax=Dactylellina haptotyla (strain CBS 200.50) TaxID=1284197 RepID=S8C0M1_DACHA|nr:hypothetical protein H072_721 [Dactylellina haptotyla CBS 200.50]
MQAAKQAVSEFLHHANKHSVDIEQETKPAILHETVAEKQHENVIHAIDREVHQHHHQIHVQPIQHQVIEEEQHHHNIIPVEHRSHHYGKDQQVKKALAAEHGKFKDEQQILPVETTNQRNVVVGEHVHHHVHDYIQPVIERKRIVPHVVHTTIPIHEHVEHEPYIHKGNVLPVLSMEEFMKKGFSLKGSKKPMEHIDYEGNPLDIDGQSHVGFGTSGTSVPGDAHVNVLDTANNTRDINKTTTRDVNGPAAVSTTGATAGMRDPKSGLEREKHTGAGLVGAAGTTAATTAAAKAYTHATKPNDNRRGSVTSSSSEEEKERRIPRSMSAKSKDTKGSSPRRGRKHSWLDKLNPRVDTTAQSV